MKAKIFSKVAAVALTAIPVVGLFAATAKADDVVKVGKPTATSAAINVLEVADAKGFFAEQGIKIQTTVFNGGGALNQAATAGVVEISLSSGSSMALSAKNAPFKAVAQLMGAPTSVGVITLPGSNIKSWDDLKGKKIAVASNTSITAMLPRMVSVSKGWGVDGITLVPLGSVEALWAATVSGAVDAMSYGVEFGAPMEAKGEAKLALQFGDSVPHFITQVIMANDETMRKRPDVLRRFVAGFLKGVAFTKENTAEAAAIMAPTLEVSANDALKILNSLKEGYIADGKFRSEDVDAMIAIYIEQGLFDKPPAKDQLYTEEFLPK